MKTLNNFIIERLKLNKNTKIKSNYFILFTERLPSKITLLMEPYILYSFSVGNLPGVWKLAYIMYNDDLVIKKIKGFIDESDYDEIADFFEFPLEYNNDVNKFYDDLVKKKIIDYDDLKELEI